MSSTTIFSHDAKSPILQSGLKSSLPYSINLVYRTQHQNQTPDAHILATFAPDTASLPQCWAAAYLDRSMRPETELWIFSIGETPSHPAPQGHFCLTCKTFVFALLAHISTLPTPPLHPDNLASLETAKQHEKEHPEIGPGVRYPISAGSYSRHLLIPSVLTLGAVHHQIVQLCLEAGLVRDEFPGVDAQLNKFLFKAADLPPTNDLPPDLRWGEMREQDLAVVQARTPIPRCARTMLALKSVGVFEKATDRAVAWTFLGVDGSLTTLHTEPEYRGKGIAKAVAARSFRHFAPDLAVDADGTVWGHANVYIGNGQSEAVCRSLGGHAAWKVFWVRIDLSRAGGLV